MCKCTIWNGILEIEILFYFINHWFGKIGSLTNLFLLCDMFNSEENMNARQKLQV